MPLLLAPVAQFCGKILTSQPNVSAAPVWLPMAIPHLLLASSHSATMHVTTHLLAWHDPGVACESNSTADGSVDCQGPCSTPAHCQERSGAGKDDPPPPVLKWHTHVLRVDHAWIRQAVCCASRRNLHNTYVSHHTLAQPAVQIRGCNPSSRAMRRILCNNPCAPSAS
jgi:hypothetical protein